MKKQISIELYSIIKLIQDTVQFPNGKITIGEELFERMSKVLVESVTELNPLAFIDEAKRRGYKKGVLINYAYKGETPDETMLLGDYFEMMDGHVVAYEYPASERTTFEKQIYDTIFDGKNWVPIIFDKLLN
ncbi:MAG: hypothetical protein IMZ64_08730 [Bacteroidetes bacterium]|nr:hypothetical protein [Bacteroidota bacterium]